MATVLAHRVLVIAQNVLSLTGSFARSKYILLDSPAASILRVTTRCHVSAFPQRAIATVYVHDSTIVVASSDAQGWTSMCVPYRCEHTGFVFDAAVVRTACTRQTLEERGAVRTVERPIAAPQPRRKPLRLR